MEKRVFVVASGGGHWQQVLLLRTAWDSCDVVYATTIAGLGESSGLTGTVVLPDCNQNTPFAALRCALKISWLTLRYKSDVVVTTGALPGVIALALGRLLGAQTIWIDSIANAEVMSKSGQMARRFAHLRLSQWEHVARASGAEFAGSVL